MHQPPETRLLLQHTQHNMPKTEQESVIYATCFIADQKGTSMAIRIAHNVNNCQAHDSHKGWFTFSSANSLILSEAENGSKLFQVKMAVMQFSDF